jgi:eukaryotic-like serine/threonine-protein kinase
VPGRVGRFVLGERLGAGGMGVVFAAWDPQLDRKVALKILRSPDGGSGSARLIREARVLAKLRHPNVVAVHEVGVHEDEVFIAMDFIEGCTLREWLQSPRSWQEVVDLFVAAGRGLAAAHDAALVHRDFKPDNLLIDLDGNPHVADFGVARVARTSDSGGDTSTSVSTGEDSTAAPPRGSSESTLTVAGALVGTPAYMAPEQLDGRLADARSDQFSFCATLYEALYGVRPYASDSLVDLLDAMEHSRLAEPRVDLSAPRWLRRIVVRGLAVRPENRFETLRELLDQLEAGRRRRGRWIAIGAAAAGALAATVATLVATMDAENSRIDCSVGRQSMQALWEPARQRALEAAFLRSDSPMAAHAWSGVRERLETYADDWMTMRRDACEATHVRGERSTDTLEAQVGCFERRLAELGGLLEIFETADESVVELALEATEGLTPISVCADIDGLTRLAAVSPLPEDPRDRVRVEQLRVKLARLRSFQNTGRYEEGLKEARARLEDALELDYQPSIADANYRLGSLLALAGEAAVAERYLETAFMGALVGGDDATAASASATAAHVVGVTLRRQDEGERWARIAESLSERIGNPPGLAGRSAQQRGNTALLKGDFATARDAMVRAIENFREAGLEGDVAETLVNLAVLERRAGNHDLALRRFEEAERRMLELFGEQHPRLSTLWNNRAALYMSLQQWDAAEVELLRAIENMQRSVDPTHPSLGHPINNLGEVYAARGEHEEALTRFDRAVQIWQRGLGPEHPLVAHSLTERSLSRSALGRHAEALEDANHALTVREREGSTEADLARTRFALALALPATQRDRAREQMLSARASFEENAQLSQLEDADAWLARHGIQAPPARKQR